MVTKMETLKTGQLVEVTLKDGSSFEGVVLENYGGGFVSRVITKDKDIGVGSWERYDLKNNARFQSLSECVNLEVLSDPVVSDGNITLTLNESVTKDHVKYYTTKLSESQYITFCQSGNYGGWYIHHNTKDLTVPLKESYFNSQISKSTSAD